MPEWNRYWYFYNLIIYKFIINTFLCNFISYIVKIIIIVSMNIDTLSIVWFRWDG